MSDLECGCSWHFAKQSDASQDVGPNDAVAEHFVGTPYASLIRESIQNSLDVVLDNTKPLRMKFEFGKIRSKSYGAFFEIRKHIEGVISLYKNRAIPKYQNMLECCNAVYNNQQCIDFIKVSDYNTKGMDYRPNDSPFHAFVRAVGLTVKDDESSGGSFGFGKAAYFLMSPLHTVLVSTMTQKGKCYFEGAANLCTHFYEDEDGDRSKYQHYGFYDNQNGRQPVSSKDSIPSKFRRDEVGTDIFIMGVDGSSEKREEAYDEMIKAALRHFWLAFLHNKLEVEIGDVCLCERTLDGLMREHFPDLQDRSKNEKDYNPRPYYEAVKNAGMTKDYVRMDRTLPLLGKVTLFLWRNKDARDSVIHMRKQRMFIYRSRSYSSSYGYYAVFLCSDGRGNGFLKSIEDPSHKKWDRNRNREYGKRIVDEIQTFLDDSIQEIFVSENNGPLGITGLEDYLFVPEELVGSSRDELDDNPFFGEPVGDEGLDDGLSLNSFIEQPKIMDNSGMRSVGKVVTLTGVMGAERKSGGDIGGHKRGVGKKKAKGKGGSPDTAAFAPSDDGSQGDFLQNVPVRYRVIAEMKNGKYIHSIIIYSDIDVEKGQIEVVVGGEENDEKIDIVRTSMGDISGNMVTNLKLSAQTKNVIELELADNMKHAIKLTAYEFK